MKPFLFVLSRVPLLILLFLRLYLKYYFKRGIFIRRFKKILNEEGVSREASANLLKAQKKLLKLNFFRIIGSGLRGSFGNQRD